MTVNDEKRHGLTNDDYVTFKEIEGTSALNQCEPKRVKVVDVYSFKISFDGLNTESKGFDQVCNYSIYLCVTSI